MKRYLIPSVILLIVIFICVIIGYRYVLVTTGTYSIDTVIRNYRAGSSMSDKVNNDTDVTRSKDITYEVDEKLVTVYFGQMIFQLPMDSLYTRETINKLHKLDITVKKNYKIKINDKPTPVFFYKGKRIHTKG